jgi:hypothetical protein
MTEEPAPPGGNIESEEPHSLSSFVEKGGTQDACAAVASRSYDVCDLLAECALADPFLTREKNYTSIHSRHVFQEDVSFAAVTVAQFFSEASVIFCSHSGKFLLHLHR